MSHKLWSSGKTVSDSRQSRIDFLNVWTHVVIKIWVRKLKIYFVENKIEKMKMKKRENWKKNKIKKKEKIGKDESKRKKSILIGSSFRKEKTWIEKHLLNGT